MNFFNPLVLLPFREGAGRERETRLPAEPDMLRWDRSPFAYKKVLAKFLLARTRKSNINSFFSAGCYF